MITKQEYEESIDNLDGELKGKETFAKIDKTIQAILIFTNKAKDILFVNGAIKEMSWYMFWKWIPLGKLAYEFICDIIKIWGNTEISK